MVYFSNRFLLFESFYYIEWKARYYLCFVYGSPRVPEWNICSVCVFPACLILLGLMCSNSFCKHDRPIYWHLLVFPTCCTEIMTNDGLGRLQSKCREYKSVAQQITFVLIASLLKLQRFMQTLQHM